MIGNKVKWFGGVDPNTVPKGPVARFGWANQFVGRVPDEEHGTLPAAAEEQERP